MPPAVAGWHLRGYRLVLRVLPASVVAPFEPEMVDLFRDHLAQATSPAGRAAVWIRALVDLASNRRALIRSATRFTGNRTLPTQDQDPMALRFLDNLRRDVRFALRLLRKDPMFATVAIATLGIAIGVNTAVFTLVDVMLLRPLPYPEPDRLAWVVQSSAETGQLWGDSQDGIAWEEIAASDAGFERAVYSAWSTGTNLVTETGAAYVRRQRVGAGYFEVLGVPPVLGRGFTPEEDLPEGPAAAVLSHRLWQRAFDGDRGVLGERIMLRGEPHTVVGIMPEGFLSSARADVWTPLRPSTTGEGGGTNYKILVRLADGTGWPEAQAQAAAVSASVNERATQRRPIILGLAPLQEAATANIRSSLTMLLAAVVTVLLIACVNLAGLLLVRGERRRREIATRMAIGGGRAAVTRQLLIESLVIAAIGGAVGMALASATLGMVSRLAASTLGVWRPVTLDLRVLAATGVLTLGSALVFGLAPSLLTGGVDLRSALGGDGGTRGVAGSSSWTRRLLLIGETGLAVVLLIAAGLLMRTFVHLQQLDPGFDGTAVYAARASFEDVRYGTREATRLTLEEGIRRLRELPGTTSAGAALGLPYQRLLNIGFMLADAEEQPSQPITNLSYATPGFFETLRMPLVAGRALDDRDSTDAPPVLVANEAFVRTYLGDGPPIGRRIAISGQERVIVGIVGDVQQEPSWGGRSPIVTQAALYMPVAQTNDGMLQLVHTWFQPHWVVRFASPAAGQLAQVERALEDVDPLLPLAGALSMTEQRREPLSRQRLLATLVSTLAAAAVFLAALGIHGLVASSVAERTREIGLRMALGATGRRTLATVVGPAVVLAAIGAGVGSLAAVAVARGLQSFLFGVAPLDPLTFVGVIVLLLAVAALAGLLPGARVLRLDPATSLRGD